MKIALLAMPFLSVTTSSLALTQLKARVKEVFKEGVEVHLFYINHDFYRYFGHLVYSTISDDAPKTGINDWIFRQEAFAGVENNMNDYFARFYRSRTAQEFFAAHIDKLMSLGKFICELIEKYRLASYDLVGVNATLSVVPGLSFCRHLKTINNRLITVMGGSSLYKEMGEAICSYFPHVDYVCSGSGLVSFPRLISAVKTGNQEAAAAIDGMFCKSNIGKVGKLSEELDINHDIYLDYSDYFLSFNRLNPDKSMTPTILLETSRGCYWRKCKFCGLNEDENKYRVKNTHKAIEEINGYLNIYDCNLEMVDNVMPRHYIKKVFPFLRVPEGRTIMYEVRGDYSEEEVKTLKQAHVTAIQPGIESLATDIHELMNKGVDAFACIAMLKHCRKYDISPAWNLIIGFPGMTEKMYKQLISTLELVTHLFPPKSLNIVVFGRYSFYWLEKEKYALHLLPFEAYEYIYPYDNRFIENVAYYFEDRNYTSERLQLISKYYMTIENLIADWRRKWQMDSGSLPTLSCYVKEGIPYIYDSRQQSVQQYHITLLEEEVLSLLQEPQPGESIVHHFPDHSREAAVKALTNLENKRLLFREGDRLMSLVIRT